MASTSADTGNPFAGRNVVLTGTLVTMKRDEAKKRLAAAGATLGDGVTKKTHLLIYGDVSWVFKRKGSTMHDLSEGHNGGRLALQDPESFRFWPRQDWQAEYYDFKEDAVFDEFVAEGLTKLSYTEGQKPEEATLIFDNTNGCVRHPLGAPLECLTRGAQCVHLVLADAGGERIHRGLV